MTTRPSEAPGRPATTHFVALELAVVALCAVVCAGCPDTGGSGDATPPGDGWLDGLDSGTGPLDASSDTAGLDAPGADGSAIDAPVMSDGDADGARDAGMDAASSPCGTDAELCATLGFECGPVTVTDRCGTTRTLPCGTCSEGACGLGGATGRCSTLAVPLASEVGGFVTHVFPGRFPAPVRAMFAVSADELWFALDAVGPVYRWRRGQPLEAFGSVEDGISGGFRRGPVTSIWASGPNDVYFAVPNHDLWHFDGTAITVVPGSDLDQQAPLHGTGPDDVWVGGCSRGVRNLSMGRWSTIALPCATCCTSGVHASRPGHPLVVISADEPAPFFGTPYASLDGALLTFVPAPSGFDLSRVRSYVQASDGEYLIGPRELLAFRPTGGSWAELPLSGCDPTGSVHVRGDEVWFGCATSARIARGGSIVATFASRGLVTAATTGHGFVTRDDGIYEVRVGDRIEAPIVQTVPTRAVAGAAAACVQLRVRSSALAYAACDEGSTRQLVRLADTGIDRLGESTGALWTNASSSVWNALSSGVIEQRDGVTGAAASSHSTLMGQRVVVLAGTADTNVWAVTDTRSVARFDGTMLRGIRLSVALAGTVHDAVAVGTDLWVITRGGSSDTAYRIAADGTVITVPSLEISRFNSIVRGPGDSVWVHASLATPDDVCGPHVFEWTGGWLERGGSCSRTRSRPLAIDGTDTGLFVLGRNSTLNFTEWTGTEFVTHIATIAPEPLDMYGRFRSVSPGDFWLGGLRVRD